MSEVSFKKYKSTLKEMLNSTQLIEEGFDLFKKDLRKFSFSKCNGNNKKLIENEMEYGKYSTLKNNLNGTIIFYIANDNKETPSKFKFLPFNKMFISCPILYSTDDEIIISTGFYILDFGDKYLSFFFWSNTINDGWGLECIIYDKRTLNIDSEQLKLKTLNDISTNRPRKDFIDFIKAENHKILRNLLYKIEKKEYTSYNKWTPAGIETKEIVYSKDVSSHKRHFWKDSGVFKIPLMSREELIQNGYGTDELVFRDGELRRDVPYRIIGSFVVGGSKPKKESNKIISLLNRRNLRCEEKIYSILKEIYPNKIIRRHDRKTLKGLELDFNIPELRLGIEYDGEQHFDKELYEKLYGDGFDRQVKRDRMKDKMCKKKNITLIRIKYDEPLTKYHIKKRLI